LTVVKQAFAKLDPQDSGLVAVEDLKRAFDASAHPVLRNARTASSALLCSPDAAQWHILSLLIGAQDVRAGKKQRDAVLSEFTFALDVEAQGQFDISEDDFVRCAARRAPSDCSVRLTVKGEADARGRARQPASSRASPRVRRARYYTNVAASMDDDNLFTMARHAQPAAAHTQLGSHPR
jgi:hypothetical protein